MKEEDKYKYANLVNELESAIRLLSSSSDLIASISSRTNEGLIINNEGYETQNVSKVLKENNDIKNNLNNLVNSIKNKL